jgi:hypothetical protein
MLKAIISTVAPINSKLSRLTVVPWRLGGALITDADKRAADADLLEEGLSAGGTPPEAELGGPPEGSDVALAGFRATNPAIRSPLAAADANALAP